jgi:hypothetical protein
MLFGASASTTKMFPKCRNIKLWFHCTYQPEDENIKLFIIIYFHLPSRIMSQKPPNAVRFYCVSVCYRK